MKQCSTRNKVIVGWMLLAYFLFFVPTIVSAEVAVSGSTLSSLEQVEPFINSGPEVLAALASIRRDEALEASERNRMGAKYFGAISYGYSNEPIFDPNKDKNSYNSLNISGGLKFPLLGSLQKEKIGKLEAEIAAATTKYHADMLLVNNLAAVRKAYATLWVEQQKEEIEESFLNTEAQTIQILRERQAQRLVLPADALEFLSVYHDVRRDLASSKLRQTRALEIIRLATGRKWDTTKNLKAPFLPSMDDQKVDLAMHPALIFQAKLVSQYEKLVAEKKRMDREANLTVGLAAARDFPGSAGNGAYITFSMSEPLKKLEAKDQDALAAVAELNRAKEEERHIRLKLEGEVKESLATATYTAAEVQARTARLVVMAESIREKMLRRMVLPGDTFEQLQHSRAQYYRAALEMLDHEERFLHAEVDLIGYVYPYGQGAESKERFFPIEENDGMRSKLLSVKWLDTKNVQLDSVPLDFSNIPKLKVPVIAFRSFEPNMALPLRKVKTAVYVWRAELFLQNSTRSTALQEIIAAGFSRILISFTPQQISGLSSPGNKEMLEALISEAKSKGIRIDLLLGDPKWAMMEHQEELLGLIKLLRSFAFEGIHLDIEPDSLPGASGRRAELLAGLADTVKAVKQITTLPISVSMHPRYLEDDLGKIARNKLLPLGLEEVVVMIYSDNTALTVERMSAIMAANPEVAFSLAQSVESDIPTDQSFADSTQLEFRNALHILEDKLAGYGLKGIFIQAWEDYKKGIAE